MLLDRLGLDPNSDQLQIIASSASIDSGVSGLDYLESFFGRDRNRFRLIAGSTQPADPDAYVHVQRITTPLCRLRQAFLSTQEISSQVATEFCNAVGGTPDPSFLSARTLSTVFTNLKAPDAMRLACSDISGDAQLIPRPPDELARIIFPNVSQQEAAEAIEGLLIGLALARNDRNVAPLPMRVHLFFRNLQGIWACTNPNCTQAPQRSSPCPTGALQYLPRLTCGCGARILELLYCEPCGEVFWGGYRTPTGNGNEWYLSPDNPDLEALPDVATFERDYLSYAIYWPAVPGLQPVHPRWTQDGVVREWRPANLSPIDGRLSLGRGGYVYYVPAMHSTNPPDVESAKQVYPSRCPRCGTDWSRRKMVNNPIRTQRTGFQKIAQVLSDTLLRQVGGPNSPKARKLVVFSDSRQDAAKLSAGIRFSHYRDAIRQALTEVLSIQGQGAQAFSAQVQGQQLTPEQQVLASLFANNNPREAATIMMAANSGTCSMPAPSNPAVTAHEVAQQILTRSVQGPFPINQIANEISSRLLCQGINPGGYAQSVLWTYPGNPNSQNWRDLFMWPKSGPVIAKPNTQLSQSQQIHLDRIYQTAIEELMDIVFASGKRSLESLLIAYPTTDRISYVAPDPLIQEAADGIIRL
ncbi:MAG: hypothetical protein IT304_12650 [Dehalococcoidia bacterium]|nr:hypothetical protein [Dehalococcoidia bacterium]